MGGGDAGRCTSVAVSAVVAVVGSAIGSGAFVGTPIDQAAGGALAADATLVAPAGPAFSIWSVIYAGLVALAAHQLLPTQRADPRQRRVGWWVAASLLLNAAWILTVQAGSVVGSLAVIVALLAVLVVAFLPLRGSRPSSRVQALLLDGVIGLYLGWVTVATAANAAAALTSSAGWEAVGPVATLWSVLLLLVVVAAGVGLTVVSGGRVSPALSLAWGLAWVAVARTTGEPQSVIATAGASVAALVVLAAPAAVRFRGTGRTGRTVRGAPS